MHGDDEVDEAGQEFAGEDGVFFDQFGEVVEPARCGGVSEAGWTFGGAVVGRGRGRGRVGVGGGGGFARVSRTLPMARVRKPKPSKTPA